MITIRYKLTRKDNGFRDDFLNFTIFGLDIGGMIKNLEKDLEKLNDPQKIEELKKELKEKTKTLEKNQQEFQKDLGDKVKIEYEINVKNLLGDDGFSISNGKFFGSLDELRRRQKTKQKIYPEKDKVKEPLTEVLEEKDHIQVIVEIPGVALDNIKLRRQKDFLIIQAKSDAREYNTRIKFPYPTTMKLSEKTLNNGILKLRYKKNSK
jgi:HSP20 family protein